MKTIEGSVDFMETVTYSPWKLDKMVTCMRNECLARGEQCFQKESSFVARASSINGQEDTIVVCKRQRFSDDFFLR